MKTFRLLLVGALGSIGIYSFGSMIVYAQNNDVDWDNVFSQENKSEVIKTLNEQQKKVSTTTSLSCDNMYQLIKDSSSPRAIPYYGDFSVESTSSQGIAVKGASTQSSRESDSSSSKTNTQIAGIDETDVIKVVGSNVYFANAKDGKLMNYQIGKTGKPVLVQWLKLPSGLSNPQFLHDGPNLIVIGSMYNDADNGTIYDSSSQTLVLQYKIDNGQLSATRAFRLQGNYVDSRLEGSKLTLVQTQFTKYIESGADIKKLAWNLGASIIYNPDNGETTKTNSVIGCDKVQSFVGSTGTSAHVTVIRSLNLNDGTFAAQSAYLGNFGTLYLDQQGIIGTVTVDRPYTWCNGLARCAMPVWQNNGQMIVTFEQHNGAWTMSAATPVIGYVPGQYAIGRRPDGGHVIVTSDWNNGARTNVFSIGRSGIIRDAIVNIAPRESFQSARTIGNKLYLVTFERTDPLFVVDIGNPDKLTILGELVIPGFSSYLHPYAPEANGKQYLIGLGQGPVSGNIATIKINGKSVTKRLPDEQGIKLDLYEIDFNKVSNGRISTKQLTSLRVGGEGTTTPALYDPRTFVWNDVTKQIYLPLSRLSRPSNERVVCMGIGTCPTISDQPIHHFYGYKIFKASPTGIKLIADMDLKSEVKGLIDRTSNDIQSLHFDTMRIGFVNNITFIINNHFIGTVLGGTKQFVPHKEIPPQISKFDVMTQLTARPNQPVDIKIVAKDQSNKVLGNYEGDVFVEVYPVGKPSNQIFGYVTTFYPDNKGTTRTQEKLKLTKKGVYTIRVTDVLGGGAIGSSKITIK